MLFWPCSCWAGAAQKPGISLSRLFYYVSDSLLVLFVCFLYIFCFGFVLVEDGTYAWEMLGECSAPGPQPRIPWFSCVLLSVSGWGDQWRSRFHFAYFRTRPGEYLWRRHRWIFSRSCVMFRKVVLLVSVPQLGFPFQMHSGSTRNIWSFWKLVILEQHKLLSVYTLY